MEKTAINTVYVVICESYYVDFDLTTIESVFQREDEAKLFCKKKNEESQIFLNEGCNTRLIQEKFTYKEMILY